MLIKLLWHLTSNIFPLLNTKIACSDVFFLVNILKYGKISFLRVSIYNVHLVILQLYTQNVSWSMFYYPVMGVIEVKMILREDSIKIGKIAFLWWVRIKPKVLNNVFLFRGSCFLLWNDSGGILSIITSLLS